MDSDEKFLCTMWKIVVTGVCILIATFAGCSSLNNHIDNEAVVSMVANGADPLRASCAVGRRAQECMVLSGK